VPAIPEPAAPPAAIAAPPATTSTPVLVLPEPTTPISIAPPPAPEPAATPATPAAPAIASDLTQTSSAEEATLNKQVEDFINQGTATQSSPEAAPLTTPTTAPAPTLNPPGAAVSATPNIQISDDIVKEMAEPEPVEQPDEQSSGAPKPATPVEVNDGISIPGKKVIAPLNDVKSPPANLDLLLAKEQQKELEKSGAQPVIVDVSKPTVEASGYLNAAGGQAGQANPNAGGTADPNSISL
jgi:hypothetical protein